MDVTPKRQREIDERNANNEASPATDIVNANFLPDSAGYCDACGRKMAPGNAKQKTRAEGAMHGHAMLHGHIMVCSGFIGGDS